MIIDVACDEGGAIETCHSTRHSRSIYYVDGVMHYCVDNIPSHLPRLCIYNSLHATLPLCPYYC